MWTAQNAYITVLGKANNGNGGSNAKTEKYFSIFFATFQTGMDLLNFLHSTIFYSAATNFSSNMGQPVVICGVTKYSLRIKN
jgi:hypothetical protein